MTLKGRSLLKIEDLSKEEILFLISMAAIKKANKKAMIKSAELEDRNIVAIFDKPSTRTRLAFEVAADDEKAGFTFLSNSHMGDKESIEDTAAVLGKMCDMIVYRGYKHQDIEKLAKWSQIPVINALTNHQHPTQTLATFLTLSEKLPGKSWNQMRLTFVGDGKNNVCNSLLLGAAKLGINMTILGPKKLHPDQEILNIAKEIALISKSEIKCSSDIEEGVIGADAIYTDVWVSMGDEEQLEERIQILQPFQVNKAMIEKTKNDQVLFMHCLPSCHDTKTKIGLEVYKKYGLASMEVTDEVFQSPNSVVFEEAENRVHTIKALMLAIIGKEKNEYNF